MQSAKKQHIPKAQPVVAKPQRILVTGGGGFLGVHLCRQLLEEGHEVFCIDNFSSGSRRNLRYLSPFKQWSLLDHDVREFFNVNVDDIYNLACMASPIHYQKDPLQTVHTCTQGMTNLLELAVRFQARVFQASTSEVYGDPYAHPQKESYYGNVNSVGPRACYDEGKRCAETLCMDYRSVHRLDVKIGRIFNTYGPYMRPDDGRVVSTFIVQALTGRPLTINGDGSQTRSFCYVDDLIRGIRALMQTPRAVAGPVNLGNPEEFSVLELAQRVLDITGSTSKITFTHLPKDDPVKRRPDIGRAKRLLGWEPRVRLDEGLRRTIAYFDEQLSRTDTTSVQAPLVAQAAGESRRALS